MTIIKPDQIDRSLHIHLLSLWGIEQAGPQLPEPDPLQTLLKLYIGIVYHIEDELLEI